MNITFLIGNGFDLSCGLKTSYPDIYEGYVKSSSSKPIIEKLKQELIKDKTNENWVNWADFEMGMAKYAKGIPSEKDFIECISDFKAYLREYLLSEQKKYHQRLSIATNETKEKIKKHMYYSLEKFYEGVSKKYQRLFIGGGFIYNFINFNYTDIFDSTMRIAYAHPNPIYHVHGSLKDGDLTLGVDNETQIENEFLLTKRGKRLFVKPFFNNEEDPEKISRIKNIISRSNCICVFGLSLGDSDASWKQTLIEWLRASSDNQLYIFDYKCSKIKLNDIALIRNEEDDQKAVFLKDKGICEDDDPIYEQIHMPIGTKIFNIDEIFPK